MTSANDRASESSTGVKPAPQEAATSPGEGSTAAPADRSHAGRQDAPATSPPADTSPERPSHPWRKRLIMAAILAGLAFGGYSLTPAITTAFNTVSTDDAYVNGHVTFLAPRVGGQVSRVLVDDNMRVTRGDLLVQLDKEPYRVELAIRQAAVTAAETDLAAARANVRALVGRVRADRFQLEHAIEDVNTRIAELHADVATLNSRRASLELARANLRRGEELLPGGGISKEDLDVRRQTVKVDEATVDQALQAVYAVRVGLGLRAEPSKGKALGDTPPDLVENYSAVRQALGILLQSVSQLGYTEKSVDSSPKQALEEFHKQDPEGNLQKIFAKLSSEAPSIKQAEAKLLQARRDLARVELDLRYCDVVSEIDGVVSRRNVNPGNNVVAGQSLMAVRSLTEIWIDANFKETQLADLRIGQRVRCEVDMYGSHREYRGRITGFTMGTGQTLALLPAQNATGNYVKIVQRLPVRIELTDYDPEKAPLFVGLSVVPYVYFKEPASGPHAGEFLQPPLSLPRRPPVPVTEDDAREPDPKSSVPPSASGDRP